MRPERQRNRDVVVIGIGGASKGWGVAMLIDGRDIEIVGLDGSPLRRLVLDPTRDCQRQP